MNEQTDKLTPASRDAIVYAMLTGLTPAGAHTDAYRASCCVERNFDNGPGTLTRPELLPQLEKSPLLLACRELESRGFKINRYHKSRRRTGARIYFLNDDAKEATATRSGHIFVGWNLIGRIARGKFLPHIAQELAA